MRAVMGEAGRGHQRGSNQGPRRWFRISMRTVHIASIVGLVGGVLFAVPLERLSSWAAATVLSGSLLIATDLADDRPYLRELRAMAMLLKLAILAVAYFVAPWRMVLLFAVIAISSVVSHMPGRLRYHRPFGD